jgi:hypothetical protein
MHSHLLANSHPVTHSLTLLTQSHSLADSHSVTQSLTLPDTLTLTC